MPVCIVLATHAESKNCVRHTVMVWINFVSFNIRLLCILAARHTQKLFGRFYVRIILFLPLVLCWAPSPLLVYLFNAASATNSCPPPPNPFHFPTPIAKAKCALLFLLLLLLYVVVAVAADFCIHYSISYECVGLMAGWRRHGEYVLCHTTITSVFVYIVYYIHIMEHQRQRRQSDVRRAERRRTNKKKYFQIVFHLLS